MGYDVNDIYQSNSDFLKAEDIGSNMWTLTISSVDMKAFDNGERKLALAFENLDKTLLLNMTNARTVQDMYGRDTDNWIGKQVMAMTMPVDYQGKKVQAIRLRAPAPTSAPSIPQASHQRPLNQQSYAKASGAYSDNPPPPPVMSADEYMS